MSQVRHDSSNFAAEFRQTTSNKQKQTCVFQCDIAKSQSPKKNIYMYTYDNPKNVYSKENQTFTLFNESHSYKTWFV